VSASASRRWTAFSLIGIATWVGVTVLVAVLNDDPADARPVLLAFAGGGATFFGIVFGVSLWQTRPRSDPELDAVLGELALEPGAAAGDSRAIGGVQARRSRAAPLLRRLSAVARAYIVLGAVVTGLGLAAILQEGYGVGSPRTTLYAMVGIVVCWALAVPAVLRYASSATESVLGPLGLAQEGARMAGERRGSRVSVSLTAKGSVTRLGCDREVPALAGEQLVAFAGRGDAGVWEGVRVDSDGDEIVVRRNGHSGASWLWDLWLAERLAATAARPGL
jgi:hypothetical protein